MPKCRILVVDDNRDSADSLATLLKVIGYDTHTAYDGDEAVTTARTFSPEVVLLDIGMPKVDGYHACHRIREESGGKEMFLVALTGWGQDEDRRRAEEAGFNHHMVKPVEVDALLTLLAKL
jgi:CheY-like chemotaxis protein